MATFDNSASTKGTATTSLTTAAWLISGTNRLLLAGMGWSAATPPNYSSVKWGGSGGTSLTQVGTTVALNFGKCAMARLIAPTAASQTLFGSLSGTTDEMCLGGASWTGIDQTTPLGTSNSATGTSTAPSVNVTSVSGDTVQDMMYAGTGNSTNIIKDATQTLIWEQESIGSAPSLNGGGESYEVASGTSTTMSWSIPESQDWVIMGVALKDVAAGGGTTGSKIMLPADLMAEMASLGGGFQ